MLGTLIPSIPSCNRDINRPKLGAVPHVYDIGMGFSPTPHLQAELPHLELHPVQQLPVIQTTAVFGQCYPEPRSFPRDTLV